MKLVFKLASAGDVFDKLIGWWTNGKYCHVEVWFEAAWATPGFNGSAYCFTSIQGTGTRFKYIDISNPTEWLVVNLPVTKAQELQAYSVAKSLLGRRYDWRDIAAFLLPPIDPDRAKVTGPPKRFICSAVCIYLCQQVGLFKGVPPGETSPDLLADLAQAL